MPTSNPFHTGSSEPSVSSPPSEDAEQQIRIQELRAALDRIRLERAELHARMLAGVGTRNSPRNLRKQLLLGVALSIAVVAVCGADFGTHLNTRKLSVPMSPRMPTPTSDTSFVVKTTDTEDEVSKPVTAPSPAPPAQNRPSAQKHGHVSRPRPSNTLGQALDGLGRCGDDPTCGTEEQNGVAPRRDPQPGHRRRR